jgi:hypothetical protein
MLHEHLQIRLKTEMPTQSDSSLLVEQCTILVLIHLQSFVSSLMGAGTWNWLQPYEDQVPPSVGTPLRPIYNSSEVGYENRNFRDDPALYNDVGDLGGFSQIARPLVDPTQVHN